MNLPIYYLIFAHTYKDIHSLAHMKMIKSLLAITKKIPFGDQQDDGSSFVNNFPA